jgi:hypothetical protein
MCVRSLSRLEERRKRNCEGATSRWLGFTEPTRRSPLAWHYSFPLGACLGGQAGPRHLHLLVIRCERREKRPDRSENKGLVLYTAVPNSQLVQARAR